MNILKKIDKMKTNKQLAELVAQSIKDYEAYLNTLTPEQQAIKRNAFWSKINITSKLVA